MTNIVLYHRKCGNNVRDPTYIPASVDYMYM